MDSKLWIMDFKNFESLILNELFFMKIYCYVYLVLNLVL